MHIENPPENTILYGRKGLAGSSPFNGESMEADLYVQLPSIIK
jgi:hypothetical protein